MSNRLTFSLASLILIFAFAAMSAMAAPGGPTVEIVEYSGVEDPSVDPATQTAATAQHTQVLDDFRVKLTFSNDVTPIDLADVGYRLRIAGSFGTTVSPATGGALQRVWTSDTSQSDRVFVVQLPNLTNQVTADKTTRATEIAIVIGDDVVTGTDDNLLQNVGNISVPYALPTIISKADATVMLEDPERGTGAGVYTVNAVFTDPDTTATAAPDISSLGAFVAGWVAVDPETAATVIVGSVENATAAPWTATYPLTVTLSPGVTTANISIDPSYIAGSNTVTVTTLMALATPSKPTFTINDDRTVDLDWNDVTDADSYTVTQKQAGEDDVTYADISASEYTTSALAIGTYTFTVKAISDGSALDSAASPASDDVVVSGVAPTVTVSLVSGSLDLTEKEFLVDFAFMKAGPDDADVPDELMGAYIKVTTDAEGMTDARITDPMVVPLRGDGNFRATIDYTGASLPLYVSLIEADPDADPAVMGVDVSDITYEGMSADATALMVGEAQPGGGEDEDPTAEIVVSDVDVSERTFVVEVTLTPADKDDGTAGDAITGFNKDDLEITGENDSKPTITELEGEPGDNSYVAILEWNRLSTRNLPFTVKAILDDSDADAIVYYKDTSDPTMDAMAEVDEDAGENTAPVFSADAATSIEGMVGTAITTADVSATDADGDTLTYSWDVTDEAALGLALDTATGMITGEPLKAHDMSHTVTVMDGNGGSATHTIQVTITDPSNTAPVFSADAATSITGMVGTAITAADVSATDADGDTLTYSWDVTDEAALGLMLDTATGMITGEPLKAHDMSHTVTVMDGNGGSATHTIQVTITDDTVKPPFFPAGSSIAAIKIWAGHPYTTPVLPKARADEGVEFLYKVRAKGGTAGDPQVLPNGFRLIHDDSENRTLVTEKSEVMAKADYEYIAYEKGNESNESKPVAFTVEVVAPIVPTAPTMVTAMEEGALAAGMDPRTRMVNTNHVEVTWVAPVDKTEGMSHDPAIPFGAPIMKYEVYQTKTVDSTLVTYPRTNDDDIKKDATTYKTPVELAIGMYGFKVAAVNSVGTGAKSDPSADVLVANPPSIPGDLRAAAVEDDPNAVTLDWQSSASDGGAPPIIGHTVYQTLDNTTTSTVADADLTHKVTGLIPGRYVFRVAAVNSDGEGPRSEGTEFLVQVPIDPEMPTNVKPTFGNETVANISATVGMAIDAVTLPAATDPDGDDGDIVYSISPNPRLIGLTFIPSTRFLSGAPNRSTPTPVTYTYTATDARGGTASLNFTINVASVAPPVVPTPSGDLAATYNRATGVTTIASGIIAANGFATIGSKDLPDLEEFFDLGGTIGLSNGDTVDDKNSRTVVISEILWGNDLGSPVDEQKKWQFIELYNTTGTAISVANWTVTFTAGRPVPASDIDQVSNRSGAGWNLDKGGNHGQTGRVTGTLATDLESAITPTNIISMYRNINYDHVEKNVANRGELVKGIPGGNGSGSWKASQRRSEYNRWIYDSKRAEHFKSTPILTASSVARSPFIINEVGNNSGDTNDWVEIRNVTTSEASLKNYHLSYVSGFDKDISLVNFHDKDIKVPGGGVLLLVNTDPKNTGIAAGRNAAIAEADQELTGATSRYYINSNLKLPDDGKFNLILRNAHDKLKASSHFMDVIGGLVVADATKGTSLWPLVATGGPHGDVIEANGRDLKSPYVYIRKNAGGGTGEHHLGRVGYTGVGYDRVVLKSDANGGTPGYDNGAVKEKIADLIAADSTAEVSISEIMLETSQGRLSLPQWIELYNSSMTHSVNTNGWKLHIENANDVETSLDSVLTLGSMTIAPNQTILIVTNTGRVSDPDHFPSTRLVNLWTTKAHRDALEMVRRTDQVFSTTGLYLKLTDKDNKLVDEFGNLDGNRRTRDEPNWTIPMGEDDDRRSSLIRVYDAGVAVNGKMAEAWVLADVTNLAFAISETYYGDPDDFGTPGFRAGGPLPVSLSKFRPVRLDDGSVRIVWITESELNNAGFNILRSETRDGEYKQINTKLIAGQGTTSERTTYTHVDTSAKPNVVYYYQIQDVSIDGKVKALRLSRLKGNVSAEGKLTTTWGELKALQ